MKKDKKIGLFIQFVLCICTIIFFIVSLFEKSFFVLVELLIALTLFAMAYNNAKIYKRKYFTVIYIIFASLIIISNILEVLL